MRSEALKRAQKAYREKVRCFRIYANKETERALVTHLEGQENIQAYIKSLIAKDLKRSARARKQ